MRSPSRSQAKNDNKKATVEVAFFVAFIGVKNRALRILPPAASAPGGAGARILAEVPRKDIPAKTCFRALIVFAKLFSKSGAL